MSPCLLSASAEHYSCGVICHIIIRKQTSPNLEASYCQEDWSKHSETICNIEEMAIKLYLFFIHKYEPLFKDQLNHEASADLV